MRPVCQKTSLQQNALIQTYFISNRSQQKNYKHTRQNLRKFDKSIANKVSQNKLLLVFLGLLRNNYQVAPKKLELG